MEPIVVPPGELDVRTVISRRCHIQFVTTKDNEVPGGPGWEISSSDRDRQTGEITRLVWRRDLTPVIEGPPCDEPTERVTAVQVTDIIA